MKKEENIIDMKKEKEELKLPFVTPEELMQFKMHDLEMIKRILVLSNTTLNMRLEQSEYNAKINTLTTLREQQEQEVKRYQELFEEFNKELANKYGIRNHKKMSIDDKTGLLRDLG